ncbi:hypothetical protein, partial [Yinghuangia soli]
MFRTAKRLLAVAPATAVGAFGLVALAPAASAGTVTPPVTCVAPLPVGTKTSPMPLTVSDLTGTSPYAPGETVRLSVDPGTSPVGSPFPLSQVTVTSTFKFMMSGAATGPVEWTVSRTFDPLPAGPIDADPFEVDFTIPASAMPGAQVQLTWVELRNHTVAAGTDLGDVVCTPGGLNPPVIGLPVENVPLPPIVDQISPTHGVLPTDVTVRGRNFTPGGTVSFYGIGAGGPTGDRVDIPVPADGVVNGVLTVTDPSTTAIGASNGGVQLTQVPFRVDVVGPDPFILPTGDVLPGPLAMQQASAGVTLSPITINGKPQTMTGVLNTVAIQDFRGSTKGWSLTAKTSDFTSDTGGTISKSSFKWTP